MKAFETGKTYSTRSICDSECIYSITIAKRTAKTITTTEGKLLRIAVQRQQGGPDHDGVETVKPNGSYSMCAIIRAG